MSFNLKGKTATVFGGTGFLGRYIVARLARAGAIVRVVTRHPGSAYFLRPNGVVGQVVPVFSSYSSPEDVSAAVAGSDIVVNCVGILFEKGRRSKFARVHADLPQWIAQASATHGVSRFVHVSALGVDESKSRYAKSKLAGEEAVRAAFPAATILRPSVIFGPEDSFFNRFASLAQISPALPLIGGGRTRFQPVYVCDVASAAINAIEREDVQGKTYELGGPDVMSFRDIYECLFAETRQKRLLITMPWVLARIKAAFLGMLPVPPLTNDQVTSLQTDSVVGAGALTLSDLGITPTAADTILPSYLDRYRPGGRFAEKKRA